MVNYRKAAYVPCRSLVGGLDIGVIVYGVGDVVEGAACALRRVGLNSTDYTASLDEARALTYESDLH